MNSIKAWLAANSITSHTAVVAWGTLTGMYATVPAFHDFIVKMYSDMPKSVHEVIAGVLIPGLIYYKATKGTTTSTTTTVTSTVVPPPTPPAGPK